MKFRPAFFTISDFIEWDQTEKLKLNPDFQRRKVWPDAAKSFLIDTILEGMPIPIIYLRQTVDPDTNKTIRDVIDGQQRLSTIIQFYKNEFSVKKITSDEFTGKYMNLSREQKEAFLSYQLTVNEITNAENSLVIDIFGRLNTYSVTLNKQEKLHAKYDGFFKQAVYGIATKYHSFWVDNKIFTLKKVARMLEAELVGDILVGMLDGVNSRQKLDSFYNKYNDSFPREKNCKLTFEKIINLIKIIFPNGLSDSNFSRPQVFYSLFLSLYHCNHDQLKGISLKRNKITANDLTKTKIQDALNKIDDIISDNISNSKEEKDFLESVSKQTTNKRNRETAVKYIIKKINHTLR